MKNKKIINSITEGAIYVALYAITAILTRYLLTSVDSLIYYIYPLPIAIYSARQKISFSISCLIASILISFIFANPLIVIGVFIPNLIIGFIFGIINVKINNKLINYIIIFVLCFITDLISILIYEQITGIGYFDEMIDFSYNLISKFITIDYEITHKIIIIAGISVLLIDSVIKELFLYLLFMIIVVRLKLLKDFKPSFKITIKYHYLISIVYIILFIATFIFSYLVFSHQHVIYQIFLTIFISLFFIAGIYLIYQFDMYIRLKIKSDNILIFLLIIILSFILFPITIIYSLILNLLNR